MNKGMVLLFALFLCAVTLAQPQQFAKFPLNPSYAENVAADKPVGFTLNMDSLTFERLISVEVHFSTFQKADTTYVLQINGEPCDTPKFFAEGVGQKEIVFECTTGVSGIGKYALELVQSNVALAPLASIYGWSEVSYFPPEPVVNIGSSLADFYASRASVGVHGTEYTPSQAGKIFVEFLDGVGAPINNGTCLASVYQPDVSSLYTNVSMTAVTDNGLYYFDFTSPPITGIYMVSVRCFAPTLAVNLTSTILQTENFEGNQSICGGTGFQANWDLSGASVYHSLVHEPESTGTDNNFISVAGGFTSGVTNSSSYLIRGARNATFNQIQFQMNSKTGTPQSADWEYNVSICTTTYNNLTANALFGANCTGAITTLNVKANLSCLFNSAVSGDLRTIPLSTSYTTAQGTNYIVILGFVSNGTYAINRSFWTTRSVNIVSTQFRRVINGSASVFAQIPDMQFLNSGAVIANRTDCLSGQFCLQLTSQGIAKRSFDASNALTVNISFYSKVQSLDVGDYAEASYYDGTYHILRVWQNGDEHNWTLNNIQVGGLNFGSNKIQFRIVTASATNDTPTFLVDNISISQQTSSFYTVNGTTYITARGGSELHITDGYSNNFTNVFSQLAIINNTVNQINTTVNNILFQANVINSTLNQILSLVQAINISVNTNIFINVTNTTVLVNTTVVSVQNVSVIVNVTNVTFSPTLVSNVTFVDNSTVLVTLVDNSTHFVNVTLNQSLTLVSNVTFVDNSTVLVTLVDNSTHIVNLTFNQSLTLISNVTFVDNSTVLVTLVDNSTHLVNVTINQTVINSILNVTNTTVVVQTTNTTVVVNTTNTTVTVITTNTTVVVNVTNTSVIVSTTNTTVVVNVTNTTVTVNTTLITVLNVTEIDNVTNVTVVVNTTSVTFNSTNTTVTVNTTSVTVVVNTTASNLTVNDIVQGVLGADVTENVVSGVVQSASPSLLGGVAFAQTLDNPVVTQCIANNTLLSTVNIIRTVNGVPYQIQSNSTRVCQYGCNDGETPNRCYESPNQTSLWIFLLLVVVCVVAVFLLLRLRRR